MTQSAGGVLGNLGRQPHIADGLRGEALTLSSVASLPLDNMTTRSVGGWSRWLAGVSLQVRVPGREPGYPCPIRWLSRAKYPVAGTILPLTVERSDPSILRIEWDEVPEIDHMIASGHPVFTDPDSAEAAVRTALAARAAAGVDTANHSAVDQAAALMGPGAERDLVYQAIVRAQGAQPAPDPVLQRQPVDGPGARILAVGYEDAGAASAAQIHGEILLSVAMPGFARFGVRWSGWIPQAKVRAQWWDVPVAVETGTPPRVRILWDQVPGAEVLTPRLHERNDRIEAQLAAPAAPGMDAYSGLLAGIADPQQRSRIEQQLAQALAGPSSSPAPLDPLDELKRLGELRAAGSLTETQFAAEKARVLARM